MWNGGHAKRAQNSGKRTHKSANKRKIKTCSIGCLALATFWQLCFASYHVDGTAQSIIASHDILVITMHELHAWTNHELHAWKLMTSMTLQHFSDRSIYRSCIHMKRHGNNLNLLFFLAYMSVCMHMAYDIFHHILYDNAYTRPSLAHKNLELIFPESVWAQGSSN